MGKNTKIIGIYQMQRTPKLESKTFTQIFMLYDIGFIASFIYFIGII